MPEGTAVSRRHFLKLIGYFGIVSLGGIGSFVELYKKRGSFPPLVSPSASSGSSSVYPLQSAFAQTGGGGTWALGQNTTVVAIHAALTSTGKIFYLAGSGYCINAENGPYTARLLDPTTGSESNVPLSDDLWCGGAAQLSNGNIFVCGGTKLYDTDVNNCSGTWHGARNAYEFDVSTGTLIKQPSMAQGRWYPTCVTLPNGKVLIVSGVDDYGDYNYITEIYDPATKTISINYDPSTSNTYCVGSTRTSSCPGAGTPCYGGPNQGTAPWLSLYPRMNLMPSGLVFTSSPLQNTYRWDPSSGIWTFVNTTSQTYRDYGSSILLPLQNTTSDRGKVLIVGGSTSDATVATNVVEIEDFNQGTSTAPVRRTVASLHSARKFILPIILPNGKVVVFGGSSQGTTNPIYIPEMFDPENESQGWLTLPAATVPRVYHGTALLLPDGSVWTASSTVNPCQPEMRTEIFKPAYFSATRPTISGTPTVGGYGQSITIPTPTPASINRVSLVRLGATTHHFDTNVRLIWLQITSTSSNSITVSAPLNANLAPPGYYMIHVLDSSLVPSTAQMIQIPGTGSSTPPAQVTGLTATTASSTQLNLAWTANASTDNVTNYRVYRSTTNGFTVNTATDTPIASPTTNSYSNTGLTASTTYYYRVAAVNTSALIGTPSNIASATTAAGTGDTTPPTVSSTAPANGATGVPVNSAVNIIFSEQMQSSTIIWQNISFTDASFNSVDRAVSLAADNVTCTVTPVAALTAGTQYIVTVLTGVKDLAGNSMASPYSFSFTAGSSGTTPPAQVTGLAVTSAGSTQLNLSWTANASTDNVTNYRVYRSTTNGFTVNTATDTPIAQPTTNSYSNTGLTASTTYYYRVAAVNNSGLIGAVSTQASGTTGAAPADTTPPAVKITSPINGTSISSGNIAVQGTSQDNVGGSGVNTVAVSLDSGSFATATPSAPGNWSTWSFKVTIPASRKGSHTLTARATDNAGNVATNQITIITT